MLITLFSDASMCEKHRVGGWAAWLKCDRHRYPFRAGAPFSVRVNDTAMAESMAVVNALAAALKVGFIEAEDVVLVQTDNNSVMGVLEGTVRRRMSKTTRLRKGLSRSQAKAILKERNSEIEIVSAMFLGLVERHGLVIRWRHVKGHRGNIDRRSAVNTYCDKQARIHMRSARSRTTTPLVDMMAARNAARAARQELGVGVSTEATRP